MFGFGKKSAAGSTKETDASSKAAEETKSKLKVTPIETLRSLTTGKQWKIGDFDMRATVGTGTFGRVRVVKISGSKDRTPFALKILKKSEVIRLKQVEHVKSEKEILKQVEHPFIVNLLATFQDEKRLCMLLEYVNGGELFSYLRQEGRLPNDHTKFFTAEITCAFEYLHGKNIVYRDLKPENLLIDCQGHLKITDFGFAKVVEDRTWTLCGTPEYLAPEIIQSKGHGKPVDWWALGILMFEMLAGYPPFYDESPFGIYQKVLTGRIDHPRHFDVKAKDLIKRLLTHDRTKRFGCLRNGVDDIKKHKWYKDTNWAAVPQRGLAPVPFQPSVQAPDDTSMFDKYPESIESSAMPVRESEQSHFADF